MIYYQNRFEYCKVDFHLLLRLSCLLIVCIAKFPNIK